VIRLGLPAVAIGYAAIAHGGDQPLEWNICGVMLGLAGMLCWVWPLRAQASSPLERVALWVAVFFPAYVLFQLVPLPLFLVRILNPTRAEIAGAVTGVMHSASFAPVSISPQDTWVHLSRVAGYALVFLLAREAIHSTKGGRWASILPLVCVGGLETALGLIQHSNGAQAISGTYYNRNHFAGLLEMILPFALMYGMTLIYRGLERGRLTTRWVITASLSFALAAGMLAAILFSQSKLGFISTLGSLFAMGVVGVGMRRSGSKRSITIAGLAVLILLTVLLLPSRELINQFGSASSDPTAEGRWPIAKDTVHLIAAYPLFGSGLGTYYPALLPYQTHGLTLAWIEAHNDYLQLLSELGLVGFLFPAVLVCAVFARATRTAASSPDREARFLGLACVGGITAILIHSFGDFNLYIAANAMTLSWIAGLAAGFPFSGQPLQAQRATATRRLLGTLAPAVCCLMTVYAGAWLLFLHSFASDPKAERLFCKFGICDSNESLNALQRQYGEDIAAVPEAYLLEFLSRSPAGPYRWQDMGESLLKMGRMAEARSCFSRALELGPRIPSVLIRTARFHFGLGENTEAIDLMARALAGSPDLGQRALTEYDQRNVAVEEVLRHGLPRDPVLWKLYLRWQIKHERISEAAMVWSAIVEREYADNQVANEYIEFLMRTVNPEAAVQAWALYAGGRSNGLEEGFPESNRVFNGDFESDSTRCRFDWRIDPRQGTAIDFDADVRHSGRRALRVRFDGTTNVADIGVWQQVFLEPGRYRFRAYVRTENVSTNEGVAFRVLYDDSPKQLDMTTESFKGSNEWTLVERVFDAPPEGGLVTVILARKPSLKFDNLIRGTAWIDQVEITAL
jgi:O-antigen ligase